MQRLVNMIDHSFLSLNIKIIKIIEQQAWLHNCSVKKNKN